MLNEIGQTQKRTNTIRFHLQELFKIGKYIDRNRRLELTRVWRELEISSYNIIVVEFLLRMMKKYGNCRDDYTTL